MRVETADLLLSEASVPTGWQGLVLGIYHSALGVGAVISGYLLCLPGLLESGTWGGAVVRPPHHCRDLAGLPFHVHCCKLSLEVSLPFPGL